MGLTFEWDEVKAKSNLQNHLVDFEEAQSVFGDVSACIFDDVWHSTSRELRELIIDHSQENRILLVSFTEQDGQTVRLISARLATKKEIKKYESQTIFKR